MQLKLSLERGFNTVGAAKGWSGRVAWVESLFPQWFPFPFTHYNFVGIKH